MREAALLFLDDEQNVLNALRRVFQDEGRPLALTTSSEEALRRVAEGGVAVAVSDYRMPTMTGIQFLEKVKEASPDTVRILLTGHADVKTAVEAINRGSVYRFLSKPWDDDELRTVLRQGVAHYELVGENRRLNALTLEQNAELRELNGGLELRVRERTKEVEALNRELHRSFMGSVRVLAGLSEVHSRVIGSHSRRVAVLAKGLALQMNLGEKEALQVEVGALLHDVGKLLMPREVINKPENFLRFSEREQLKRHPLMGETLVRMVPNMETAALLVRHHHERFAGGGSPDKLSGPDIPMGSRIIAVADAYDNELNVRTEYQSASPMQIIQRIKAAEGEFDPAVIEALEAFLRESGRFNHDAEEVEIGAEDLKTGMRLSRDFRNARGTLLLPSGSVLGQEALKIIAECREEDRSQEGIFIHRNAAPSRPRTPA